jgi:hypothetical protein
VILKLIESRSEKVGQFVAALMGMAWSVTTYFVVPVLVVEKVGPVQAVQRSLAILRKTWGEALFANFGVGLIGFLISLPAFLVIVAGGVGIGMGHVALGVAAIVLGFILLMLGSLVVSTLNSILLAALYLYAAEDSVPEPFDRDLLTHAFGGRSGY